MSDRASQPETVIELDREVLNAAGTRFTVRELRARVSIYEPGIILYEEIESGTPETLTIMGGAVEDLASGFGSYGLVVDLAGTSGTTSPAYRRFIPEFFDGLNDRSDGRLKLVAVVFLGNPVMRIATKFIASRMTRVPFSIEKSRAHALDAVRNAVRGKP